MGEEGYSSPGRKHSTCAQPSADEKKKAASKDLDSIFEISALILNWSSFVSAIMTVVRHFVTLAGEQNDELAPRAVGLLFFLTIVLGIYLMMASTVRNTALNLPTKYLDVLLIFLLLSTLAATVITFSGADWKDRQSPPARRIKLGVLLFQNPPRLPLIRAVVRF